MRIPITQVPAAIEWHWNAAAASLARWQEALDRAARSEDDGWREMWLELAALELEATHALQANADDLLEQFQAAGGVCEWKQ
jgi:hypothetical protein